MQWPIYHQKRLLQQTVFYTGRAYIYVPFDGSKRYALFTTDLLPLRLPILAGEPSLFHWQKNNSTDHCSKPCFVTLYSLLGKGIPGSWIVKFPAIYWFVSNNPPINHQPTGFTQPQAAPGAIFAASLVLFHAQNAIGNGRFWAETVVPSSFPSSWESVGKILSNIAIYIYI